MFFLKSARGVGPLWRLQLCGQTSSTSHGYQLICPCSGCICILSRVLSQYPHCRVVLYLVEASGF
jgi:hypothetical protein